MTEKPKTKTVSTVESFNVVVQQMEPKLRDILPKHLPVEKFSKVLQTAVTLKPELVAADRRLLWGEIMKCAQDGLVPDGREATIYAFGNKPKYIPMVAGICKKARNSGLIQTIDAQVVYENDIYEAWIDEKGQHFRFSRAKGERGEVRLTFAYALTKDEGFFFEEIAEDQMVSIEKISKAKDGPWKGPFKDEMRRKSAIRRLAKYRLPSSADLEDVVRRDDDMYDLDGKDKEEKPKAPPNTPSRLKGIIDVEPENVPDTRPEKIQVEPKPEPKPEPDQAPPPEEPPI